jgi:arylsulfatase A-like enzyme
VPIYSTDYFPTFLSAAGIPLLPEDHVDGYDLVPLLKDGTAPSRDTYYWHYPHDHKAGNQPSGSILVGRYKLVTFFRTKTVELYDLENDLSELKDLSSAMPEKTQELLTKLQTWQKTLPDISYGTPERSNPLTGVRKQK